MQMDSRRNHIIMVNLWLSMLNISVMATTVLPAFFGMNLDSGLAGDDPRYFILVGWWRLGSWAGGGRGCAGPAPACAVLPTGCSQLAAGRVNVKAQLLVGWCWIGVASSYHVVWT